MRETPHLRQPEGSPPNGIFAFASHLANPGMEEEEEEEVATCCREGNSGGRLFAWEVTKIDGLDAGHQAALAAILQTPNWHFRGGESWMRAHVAAASHSNQIKSNQRIRVKVVCSFTCLLARARSTC